jgi:hypothetical protein
VSQELPASVEETFSVKRPCSEAIPEQISEVSAVTRQPGKNVEYRTCPNYPDYVAGEDGSLWRGYLNEPRHTWKRMTPHANGACLGVWVLDDEGQHHRRLAELILDAWSDEPRQRYIGYKDADPRNCRPDNLYWSVSPMASRRSRRQKSADLRRRAIALHQSGDSPFEIASVLRVSLHLINEILATEGLSCGVTCDSSQTKDVS